MSRQSVPPFALHLLFVLLSGCVTGGTLGVEVPIANTAQGEIPVDRAQSLCASCANQAAKTTLATVTPATPIGIACEEFKTLYELTLRNVIDGARVPKKCRQGIPPVRLTPPRR